MGTPIPTDPIEIDPLITYCVVIEVFYTDLGSQCGVDSKGTVRMCLLGDRILSWIEDEQCLPGYELYPINGDTCQKIIYIQESYTYFYNCTAECQREDLAPFPW